MTSDVAEPRVQDRGFFGHPRPLANLFGVEMWERFSFYGMQGILVLYLYFSAADGGLGISKATATGIVGAYGGGGLPAPHPRARGGGRAGRPPPAPVRPGGGGLAR